ncbi:xyloglucan-specific galacturonosyltransferase 1 [Camellia sinensis]|uniref:xyloglucan-specific galacturonosyltransferase 1 n=1 Tax=Camellia sinensis TaxID=4442 RepID=UPI001035F3CC|nr:xyloglucan-specific galacturonosyltransferase 1 [Camellia sinensis]
MPIEQLRASMSKYSPPLFGKSKLSNSAATPLTRKPTTKPCNIQQSLFSSSKMAVADLSKKNSKIPKRLEPKEPSFFDSILTKLLYRVPLALLLLILVFLWSSSTTIISGNILHVCVSSRKLNNLYCLSAGTQPNLKIPIPVINNSFINHQYSNLDIKQTYAVLPENSKNDIPNHETPVTIVSENDQMHAVLFENPVDRIVEKGITKYMNEEVANAVKVVEEQLQLHRSWVSNSKQATCNGRGIYVYELPPRFNKGLTAQCGDMIPWIDDFCKYLSNEALGEPIPELGKGWYRTHQYSLEPIFHSRVLKHPCRVYNENEAKLFYVPYYGGLDILRWHFKNVSNDVKDSLALDLVKWLESRTPWPRNSGKDHVFVLGKISWDFRRFDNSSSWGTRLLELNQMQNPIKLLIERQPWHVNDIGIPHPTHFHPQSDNDVVDWQLKIIRSNRKNLVSFAGAARPGAPDNIRSTLIKQCTNSVECQLLNCSSGGCDEPESIIELFMESEFCLQPPGDSPTRKSVFDSLVSGCIPVLFDPFTAYYQYPWHLPQDHEKYSVFIDKEEVREVNVNVVEKLMEVPAMVREDMRRYIVYELLPGLVYGDPNSELEKFQDAFTITVNNLLERVSRL